MSSVELNAPVEFVKHVTVRLGSLAATQPEYLVPRFNGNHTDLGARHRLLLHFGFLSVALNAFLITNTAVSSFVLPSECRVGTWTEHIVIFFILIGCGPNRDAGIPPWKG